ncbi:MAG: excinuclease ABC subunit UvrA [Clostridiales Family XIII bacterium]|jgi:excinuclease ABC subunit A|nr:excinuclease ABC subunit UvrA [Clostridiales Family XIII bacterium]
MLKNLIIKGAKEHNLKNISVEIPRDKFTVITGLSGSGKSSLAFDTIYAEGQRRYVESLSSYARQFLGQMEKPNVEFIEGLSPAISIDQKTTSKNPRSTVGTVTEIHDYFRLLYARVGIPHCPICGREISAQTVDQIVDNLLNLKTETKLTILAPLIRERKGTYEKVIDRVKREGFSRIRIDGEQLNLFEDDLPKLKKTKKHSIEIVIDRVIIKNSGDSDKKEELRSRLSESVETAITFGEGQLMTITKNKNENDELNVISTNLACPEDNFSMEKLEPKMFSFNSPFGACPECNGLGFTQKINPDMIIDMNKSVLKGALKKVFANMEFLGYWRQMIEALFKKEGGNINTPLRDLPKSLIDKLLYGTGNDNLSYAYQSKNTGRISKMNHPFEGVLTNLERRYRETNSEYIKKRIEENMTFATCNICGGKRYKEEILAVTVGGKNISDLSNLSITDTKNFFDNLRLSNQKEIIAEQIVKEIKTRLSFLINVGLNYLTLSRQAGSLSGGEAQRIRLATQIGSALMGVLYILDEPSIGLHQRDNGKLLEALRKLTDIGNTLIVVEHDKETMFAADNILDIGPGAGEAGGYVVAEGDVKKIMKNKDSLTGKYLAKKLDIKTPTKRREGNNKFIEIKGAKGNNLKSIDVKFPLGKFICVTGVSGSGKSTLINETLYKAVHDELYYTKLKPYAFKKILGLSNIDKIIDIDQSPIGRTPRSNPATYTGVFDPIRTLFASLPSSRAKGFEKGRFSFNVSGGRCEACKGDGVIKIEMHFLPDIYVPCEVCKGKRYNKDTLSIKYKGKNIFDILDMDVKTGLEFFEHIPTIESKLRTLNEVGLSYIKLGQPSTTLSGGEAQRVKLATELSKRETGNTLYILDEPTTGLHFADIAKLIDVLNKLVDTGNTVIVIEHNLDVIKSADYIIDLGPEGGDMGGEIIGTGSPEELMKNKNSYTGIFLKKELQK